MDLYIIYELFMASFSSHNWKDDYLEMRSVIRITFSKARATTESNTVLKYGESNNTNFLIFLSYILYPSIHLSVGMGMGIVESSGKKLLDIWSLLFQHTSHKKKRTFST